MNAPGHPQPGASSAPDDLAPRKLSPWRIAFRVIRWTTYAAGNYHLADGFSRCASPGHRHQPAGGGPRRTESRSRGTSRGQRPVWDASPGFRPN